MRQRVAVKIPREQQAEALVSRAGVTRYSKCKSGYYNQSGWYRG